MSMTATLYCVTRNDERVAGSLAVPLSAALTAARLLNRESRRRVFEVAPDPTATVWEELQADRFSEMAACASRRTC